MKRRSILIGLALAAAAGAGAAPAKGRAGIDQAAWLAGHWTVETEGRWTEERWVRPRGGVMLGTSLSGKGAAASAFEFMRIAVDAHGRLVFWGAPDGKPAVPFQAVDGGGTYLAFENPAHDYPTRITYRREGEGLTATISGPGGANPMSWRYRRGRD